MDYTHHHYLWTVHQDPDSCALWYDKYPLIFPPRAYPYSSVETVRSFLLCDPVWQIILLTH